MCITTFHPNLGQEPHQNSKGTSMISTHRRMAHLIVLTISAAASAGEGGEPPRHTSCIEHAGEVQCLLFCSMCGHHGCTGECQQSEENTESEALPPEVRAAPLQNMVTHSESDRIPIIDDIAELSGEACGAGNLAEDYGPACFQFYNEDGTPANTNSACVEHDLELRRSGKSFSDLSHPEVRAIHRALAKQALAQWNVHFYLLFSGMALAGDGIAAAKNIYESAEHQYGELERHMMYWAMNPWLY